MDPIERASTTNSQSIPTLLFSCTHVVFVVISGPSEVHLALDLRIRTLEEFSLFGGTA
jgi:hypothetical protein